MKSILFTKIGNDEYALVAYPFSSPAVKFRGLNLTVIVLVPMEFDDLYFACNRFINLSTITCKKITIAASTFINMGTINSETKPDTPTVDRSRHHAFKPKEQVLTNIWDVFWRSIIETKKKTSSGDYKDVITIDEDAIKKGMDAVENAVSNYSPQRVRKY